MAIYENKVIFIEEHIQRLNKTLSFLKINKIITRKEIFESLVDEKAEYYALRIMVSKKTQ